MNGSLADYVLIVAYIGLIFFLAWKAKLAVQKDKASDAKLIEEKYLAGRSLTFWESMGSIIATETSALTFLGIPAFAISKDFSFLQIYMGALFGRILIARIFIPSFYAKGLTVFEVVGHNSTLWGKRLMASFYSVAKVLAVGVRLFSGCILIAEFFNLHIMMAILGVSLITVIYTMIGGLKAVVRTDMMQLVLFVLGGFVAHFIIPDVAGADWSAMIEMAYAQGKMNIFDPASPWPFVVGLLGGFMFDLGTHGVDQDFVQRLMAAKDQATAKKAIFFSSFMSLFVGSLFLSVGALLWSYGQLQTLPDIRPDRLFAYFITEYFPSPLKGLMVAGVLAATMSTLDSTINALSATLWNDIFRPKTGDVDSSSRFDTLIMTALLAIVALASTQSQGMLILGLKVASWTGGSLLALFLATTIFKFLKSMNATSVIVSYLLGIALVGLNTFVWKFAWQWNVYLGVGGSLIFLYAQAQMSKKS